MQRLTTTETMDDAQIQDRFCSPAMTTTEDAQKQCCSGCRPTAPLVQQPSRTMAFVEKRDWIYPSVANGIVRDDRLLGNLMEIEDHSLVAACSYFQSKDDRPAKQPDFGPLQRAETVKWMTDVCEAEPVELDVLVLAVSLMDKFLGEQTIYKEQLQTLATACLMIAGKLKLPQPMSARRLSEYTANSVEVGALISWEFLILQRLKWDVSLPTVLDLTDAILGRFDLTKPTEASLRLNCHRLVPRLLLEHALATLPASLQASICVVAGAYLSVSGSPVSVGGRPQAAPAAVVVSFVNGIQKAVGQLMDLSPCEVLSEYAEILLDGDRSNCRSSQSSPSSVPVLGSIENLMADDKSQFATTTLGNVVGDSSNANLSTLTTPTDVQDVVV